MCRKKGPTAEEEEEEEEEKRIYQEELESRKKADIFTNVSSSEFLSFLQPENDHPMRQQQDELEKQVITTKMRAFKNKMPAALDQPLEPEPRIQVNAPKPESKGHEKASEDHVSALDGLAALDKQPKSRGYGFYGKY